VNRLNLDWCSLAARRTATTLITLNLSLNSATIWSGTDGWKIWTDSLNETRLHLRVGIIKSSLNDIVGERISEELIKLSGLQHLLNQEILGALLSAAKTLFNDVGTELLLGQLRYSTGEHEDQRLGEDWLVEVKDVLDDVISEWILDQNIRIVGDLANQPSLLISRSMIDTTLKNTAAMTMSSHIDTVGSNRIEDELGIGRGELIQALLNDVIAVQVLN